MCNNPGTGNVAQQPRAFQEGGQSMEPSAVKRCRWEPRDSISPVLRNLPTA
jgi:hypothetical protein